MTTIVKRFVGLNKYAVSVASGSTPLPAGFIIHPGNYAFNGVTFDCSQDGYYFFWNPLGGPSARRIVYSGDIPTLMSSLAKATCVGSLDDDLTNAQITNAAVNRRPQILCGDTVAWAKYLCDSLGNVGFPAVTTRIVATLTDGTTTGYFDGHRMLEATVSGSWQLFDVAAGSGFGGLAAKDAIPLTSWSRWLKKKFATSALVQGLYDCDAWEDCTLFDDEEFGDEFMRVLQIVGILDVDGKIRCYLPAGMEGAAAYVTSCGFTIQTHADWLAQHYP